jgi:hypothetical protein
MTSSSSPSSSLVMAMPPPADATSPMGSTSRTPEVAVVVVSTSDGVSGIAAPYCTYEEDTPAASSVIVAAPPVATTPATESGSGGGSPLPWAASATGSWGLPPLVAPVPPEPRDASAAFGFTALQHANKDQKAYVKSGKGIEKIYKKNAWHTPRHCGSTCGEGWSVTEPPQK